MPTLLTWRVCSLLCLPGQSLAGAWTGPPRNWGCQRGASIFGPVFGPGGGVEWILRLAAARGEGPCVGIMEISKSDDLGDIANLRLTIAEAKQLLARVQCEISTAQAREHPVRRPVCSCRDGVCRVKGLSRSFDRDAVWPCHDQAATFPLRLVRPDRDRHQLAITLPVDTGTGPAPGASVRPDELPGGRRATGAHVSGRNRNGSGDVAPPYP